MGYTVQWETINNGEAVIKVRLLHRNLPTGSNVKMILIALEIFIKWQKTLIPGKSLSSSHHAPGHDIKQSQLYRLYTIKTQATRNNSSSDEQYETQLGCAECGQC